MRIVINIPERIYYGVEKGITVNGSKASQILIDAVKNGTPLPKGELITKGQAVELVEWYQLNPQHFDFVNLIDEIHDEKPVIEAEDEEE